MTNTESKSAAGARKKSGGAKKTVKKTQAPVKKETMPEGCYPLTFAQKMHFYTVKFCPKRQVLNIGISLTVQDDLDFDLMRRSIYEAYERCDAMRLRFHETEDGRIWQYFAPKEEREIEEFLFAHWQPEHAADKMREWTAIPFDRQDSPMNRIVIISMPDNYKGLYLNVDHMTMDSHGIIVFMKDLIQIYCAHKYDTPYPEPVSSYEEVLKKELEYADGSAQLEKDRQYWEEQMSAPEPIYTDLNGRGLLERQREEEGNPNLRAATIVSETVDACLAKFHLEPEPSSRLLQFCADYEVTPVCLFLTGLRTYLSKMNDGEEDVSIKTTVSRRGKLQEKHCGGTRIHFFPCRTVISRDKTFLEAVSTMRAAQYSIFRHANFSPIDVLNMRKDQYQNKPGQGYECISLTYQPATRRDPNELHGIQYKTEWYSNGVAASPLYLTIMHDSYDDGMDFYFEYQKGRTNQEELSKFYYYLGRILFKAVEHPDWTVGEIMDAV